MIKDEDSWQAMIIGQTGTGKSLTAIKLCQMIDPTFNIDRIVLKPQDFLKLINTDLPPGAAILADEIGSWMSGRDWMTTQNKLMSLVLETYRFRRLAVLWTVPTMRMVDINLRSLCHVIIETVAIDRTNEQCEIKFKYHSVNPQSGKIYDKFPVINNSVITRIKVKRPDAYIENQYIKKKSEHMAEMYKDVEDKLNSKIGNTENEYTHECNKCGHKIFSRKPIPQCSSCGSRDCYVL